MKKLWKYLSTLGLMLVACLCLGVGLKASGFLFAVEGGEPQIVPADGGTACVYIANGKHEMKGGTIGGKAYGIYISGGTFTMSGGTISNCSSYGVYLSSGTFNYSAGTISDEIYLSSSRYITLTKAPTSTLKIRLSSTSSGTKVAYLSGISSLTSTQLSYLNVVNMPSGYRLEVSSGYVVLAQSVTNYTVTISAGSGGSVSRTSVSVPSGTTYTTSGSTLRFSNGTTVTATANSGYTFDYWSPSSGTITGSTTIRAYFTESYADWIPTDLISKIQNGESVDVLFADRVEFSDVVFLRLLLDLAFGGSVPLEDEEAVAMYCADRIENLVREIRDQYPDTYDFSQIVDQVIKDGDYYSYNLNINFQIETYDDAQDILYVADMGGDPIDLAFMYRYINTLNPQQGDSYLAKNCLVMEMDNRRGGFVEATNDPGQSIAVDAYSFLEYLINSDYGFVGYARDDGYRLSQEGLLAALKALCQAGGLPDLVIVNSSNEYELGDIIDNLFYSSGNYEIIGLVLSSMADAIESKSILEGGFGYVNIYDFNYLAYKLVTDYGGDWHDQDALMGAFKHRSVYIGNLFALGESDWVDMSYIDFAVCSGISRVLRNVGIDFMYADSNGTEYTYLGIDDSGYVRVMTASGVNNYSYNSSTLFLPSAVKFYDNKQYYLFPLKIKKSNSI